jgi:hypothetical protein
MEQRRFFVLFGSLFLIVGTVLLVQGAALYRDRNRFHKEWQRVEATLLRKWIVAASRQGPLASEYRLQYQIPVPGRPAVIRIVEVDAEEWEPLREGGAIPVLYPQSAPERSRLASEGEPASGYGEIAGGLCSALFGGTLAGWNVWLIRRQRTNVVPQPGSFSRMLRGAGAWTLRIAAVFLFVAIAENIPALQRLVEYMALHEPLYVSIAVGVMLLGGVAVALRRPQLGAVLAGLGFLGIFFAVGPAFVKAGVAAVVLYAGFRLAR